MSAKFLLIPEEARLELEALLELDSSRLRRLRDVLGDRKALKEGRGYQRIASELGVGNDKALKILSATSNLRAQRERFELSDEALVEDLSTFSSSLTEEQKTALLELLGEKGDDYFIEKLSSLKHALVPHLLDARTIVDARPVFNRERTNIEGFLLVTYLELTAHDSSSDGYRSIPLYLTRKDIASLQDCLKDADTKLAKLEASLAGSEVFD